MLHLSQRDPQWASFRLGGSTLAIGRYGCTTTCVAMLTSYFNLYYTPLAIALRKYLYTSDGLLIWGKLDLAGIKFVWRAYGEDKARIDASLKDPNTAVILQVDNVHWVVAARKTLFGSDYVIIDPWDGKKKNLKSAYKKITGSAHFKRA